MSAYYISLCYSSPYDNHKQMGFSDLKIRISKCNAKFLHLCACTVAVTQEFSGYGQGVRDEHMTVQAKQKKVHGRKQKSSGDLIF